MPFPAAPDATDSLPPAKAHDVAAMGSDDARAVLDAVRGDRIEALVTVTLATGLRQGEALGLRWQDVDLKAGTLTVHTRSSGSRAG